MVRKEKDDFLTPQGFAPANCLIRGKKKDVVRSSNQNIIFFESSAGGLFRIAKL